MISETYQAEVQAHSDMLSEEGRQGDMWCEAQAQCLESWIECGYEYTDEEFQECIVEELAYKTEAWLRGQMDDCSEEELEEGGSYHWMVQALS